MRKIGKKKLIKDSLSNYEYLITSVSKEEVRAFRKFANKHPKSIYMYSVYPGVLGYYINISCTGNRGRILVEDYFKALRKINIKGDKDFNS